MSLFEKKPIRFTNKNYPALNDKAKSVLQIILFTTLALLSFFYFKDAKTGLFCLVLVGIKVLLILWDKSKEKKMRPKEEERDENEIDISGITPIEEIDIENLQGEDNPTEGFM